MVSRKEAHVRSSSASLESRSKRKVLPRGPEDRQGDNRGVLDFSVPYAGRATIQQSK